jgi:tetratricopeptide (TPR) repeat protein
MLSPYPALIPEGGWPSVGVLDALCRSLRGRGDLTAGERLFVSGTAAHIGELVDTCWRTFAMDVRVENDGDAVVCSGRGEDGATYSLPLEKAILAVLRDPRVPQYPPGQLPFAPVRGERVLEIFALTACLGASRHGEGSWTRYGANDLSQRVETVVPLLAASCAQHYARLCPQELLGQNPDLYRQLIWPLTLCDGAAAYEAAGANLLAYLDGALAQVRGAVPLLENLARFPTETVRDAALVCLILDDRLSLPGDLLEIAADHFRGRAPAFRQAAIRLAAKRGHNIDWTTGGEGSEGRFKFERRLGLLPLVYLPYADCLAPKNLDLVAALLELNAYDAVRFLERSLSGPDRSSKYLFQLAMVRRWVGDLEASEAALQDIVRTYPEQLDAEFYTEAGAGALAMGRVEDAITRLERARKLGGPAYRVEPMLGSAYAAAGRSEEAVAVLGDAIANGQLRSDVLVSRAEARRILGQHEGYARDLAAAAEVYPFNTRVVDRVLASYVDA